MTPTLQQRIPDSKIHGANMGPIWVLSAPDGPHVGPMNPAIRNTKPVRTFYEILWWNCKQYRRAMNPVQGSHFAVSPQWRQNERDGDSNHWHLDCMLNRLFRRRSKETSKLRVTGLCEGNPPVTGGFLSQRANNADNVSVWWRHHELLWYTGRYFPFLSHVRHWHWSNIAHALVTAKQPWSIWLNE